MQSYEKQIWHCRFLSEFVRICRFLSVFVGFRNNAFSRCKDTKRKFGTHLLSLFVTFCHLSANCFFSLQSYEKEIWHCLHLSAYVRKCPHLSVFDIATSRNLRCKVTKKHFGIVTLVSPYASRCHLSVTLMSPCEKAYLFFAAKLRKRKLAMSSLVQLCPFMSSYGIATPCIYVAKLRNRNLAMSKFVQICPILSI